MTLVDTPQRYHTTTGPPWHYEPSTRLWVMPLADGSCVVGVLMDDQDSDPFVWNISFRVLSGDTWSGPTVVDSGSWTGSDADPTPPRGSLWAADEGDLFTIVAPGKVTLVRTVWAVVGEEYALLGYRLSYLSWTGTTVAATSVLVPVPAGVVTDTYPRYDNGLGSLSLCRLNDTAVVLLQTHDNGPIVDFTYANMFANPPLGAEPADPGDDWRVRIENNVCRINLISGTPVADAWQLLDGHGGTAVYSVRDNVIAINDLESYVTHYPEDYFDIEGSPPATQTVKDTSRSFTTYLWGGSLFSTVGSYVVDRLGPFGSVIEVFGQWNLEYPQVMIGDGTGTGILLMTQSTFIPGADYDAVNGYDEHYARGFTCSAGGVLSFPAADVPLSVRAWSVSIEPGAPG